MQRLLRTLLNTTGFAALLLAAGCSENPATLETASSRGDTNGTGVMTSGLGLSSVIPPTGSWTSLRPMPTARYGLASTALDGLVYAIGGAYLNIGFQGVGRWAVEAVEAYDPATDTWRTMAPLPPGGRVYPNGATVIGGRIYLSGGAGRDTPSAGEYNTLFIFDPAIGPQGTWTVGPPMPHVMLGGTSGAIDDQLYVLAGWDNGYRNYFLRYDPANLGWTELTGSPSGHTWGASAVIGGKFYASGGEGSLTPLDIYDPANNSWTSKTMPVGYQHHAAVAIGNILYLVGGNQFINGNYTGDNVVMAYDPQSDSWTTPAPVPAAGGPYAGNAGTSLTFSGSSSNTLSLLPSSLDLPAAASVAGALYIMGGTVPPPSTGALSTLLGVNPPGTAPLTYSWDFGDGQQGTGVSPAHVYAAPGNYTITLTVATPDGRSGGTTAQATINASLNVAPVITRITLPGNPVPLGTSVGVTADFTDANQQDSHTGTLAWDDGTSSIGQVSESNGAGSASGAHSYPAAGVYTLGAAVSDGSLTGTRSSELDIPSYIVVYDPSAGFVTGGGWITSPAGAYPANPALTGKASFGFVSKYKKGKTIPEGNTEFQFHEATFNFSSSTYEWLVLAGAKAQYKGVGTVNGGGSYGFLLTAIDGDLAGGGGADRFRIKIWEQATGAVVYDNKMGSLEDSSDATVLGGGSIVIHK
jgi:N-acetylneuraminic acid mutarotase